MAFWATFQICKKLVVRFLSGLFLRSNYVQLRHGYSISVVDLTVQNRGIRKRSSQIQNNSLRFVMKMYLLKHDWMLDNS